MIVLSSVTVTERPSAHLVSDLLTMIIQLQSSLQWETEVRTTWWQVVDDTVTVTAVMPRLPR